MLKKILLLIISLTLSICLLAQSDDSVPTVNPNRPSFSTPASISVPGYFEMESGVDYQRFNGGDHSANFPQLLKLSMNKRFEWRFGSTGYLLNHFAGEEDDRFGDVQIGYQWILHNQKNSHDRIYTIGNSVGGLGTDLRTFSSIFIASGDLGLTHYDFNIGQVNDLVDKYLLDYRFISLAFSRPMNKHVQAQWEIYGIDPEGQKSEIHGLVALAFPVRKDLSLDIGFDQSFQAETRSYQILAGATFFIGHL